MKSSKVGMFISLGLCLFGLPMGLFDDVVINPTFDSFVVNSTLIGPYESFCEDQKISFTVTYKNIGEYRPRLNVLFDNNTRFYQSLPKQNITSKFTVATYDFVIPTKTSLNENGMHVLFSIYNSENTTSLTSFEFDVKTLVPTTFKTEIEKKLSYSKGGYAFQINDNRLVNYYEHVTNDNFKDYFDINYYYCLPLEQFNFTYRSDLTYQLGTATISFVDLNNCFPYVRKNLLGHIEIPLTISQTGNNVSLDYTYEMYVNPKTLQMSSRFMPDYVLTRKFFLPINEIELLNGTDFVIKINEFGSFKTNIVWKSKLMTNRTLIGDCDTSEYCIVGEPV